MDPKLYQVIATTPVGVFKSKPVGVKDMEVFTGTYDRLICDETPGFMRMPFISGNGNSSAMWIPGSVLRNSVIEVVEI